ncbi:hypothetical protein [Nocardioides jishulii]|uniref:Uncharacterized protein n=1 Tax=Nocardioides jishulii TaxID=2575440 RepID=A0A4U2YQX9_9ACTN|nr:hypothetical protein [Nocardioides jishulii]QCX26436.1 hypothetical protein FCL41_01925 [Nocardioides jishulii]TKI63758.1 hypothetical protein FC770_00780 [Nocardioides jishulii]
MTTSTPLRLAAFAAALVVVFALAFGAGRLVDGGEKAPDDRPSQTPSHAPSPHSPSPSEESHDHVD